MKVWQIRIILTGVYVFILLCSLLSFILASILWTFWLRLCDAYTRDDCLMARAHLGIKYTDLRRYVCCIALYGLLPNISVSFYSIVSPMVLYILSGSRKSQSSVTYIAIESIVSLVLTLYSFIYVCTIMISFFYVRCEKGKQTSELNPALGEWFDVGRMGCSTVLYRRDAFTFHKDVARVDVNAFLISVLCIQGLCGLLWALAFCMNVYVMKFKLCES